MKMRFSSEGVGGFQVRQGYMWVGRAALTRPTHTPATVKLTPSAKHNHPRLREENNVGTLFDTNKKHSRNIDGFPLNME